MFLQVASSGICCLACRSADDVILVAPLLHKLAPPPHIRSHMAAALDGGILRYYLGSLSNVAWPG